jgi:hypothetical protein
MYRSFGDEIYNIGEEIVRCPLRCRAVVNDPEKGIIPRGLIFEDDGSGKLGCIIVGINPGNADEEEREYLRRKPTYRAWLEYWEERFKDKKYYKKARELAGELLGFKGSILWTELCKCEKSREVPKAPPISTLVTCMKRFLDREMKLVKEFFGKNIPIIALGRRTFEAVCFRYSDHFTVGVPHPTGSYGDFNELYSLLESPKNLAKVKSLIDESKNNKENCVEIFHRNLERIKIYSLHE